MTKTQIKNALTKAGLLTSETTVYGRGTNFTVETTNATAAAMLEAAGLDVRELRGWQGESRSWRAFGAGFGSDVASTTRDLIAANVD
jgi:hypothetical protein